MNRLHSLKRRRDLPALALGPLCAAVAIGLAGCEDPSADLQTRLTYSQKELESAKAEIQKLREAAGRPAVSEESFQEEAKNFSRQLETELKGATVTPRPNSEVNTNATYRAIYRFALTMADGNTSFREVVATATSDGRWNFPTAGEFARTLAAVASRESVIPIPTPPPVPTPTPTPRPTIDPMEAKEKVNVEWRNKVGQPGAPQNQGVPAQQQSAKQTPPPVPPRAPSVNPMKADEEKNVSFDRKKK